MSPHISASGMSLKPRVVGLTDLMTTSSVSSAETDSGTHIQDIAGNNVNKKCAFIKIKFITYCKYKSNNVI